MGSNETNPGLTNLQLDALKHRLVVWLFAIVAGFVAVGGAALYVALNYLAERAAERRVGEKFISDLVARDDFRTEVLSHIDPLPISGVLASTKPCSEVSRGRWTSFSAGEGRFLVGHGAAKDINGISEEFRFGVVDRIGEYRHALTVPELAEHQHAATSARGGESYQTDDRGNEGSLEQASVTGFEGGSVPHNNIPPYVALFLCEQVR